VCTSVLASCDRPPPPLLPWSPPSYIFYLTLYNTQIASIFPPISRKLFFWHVSTLIQFVWNSVKICPFFPKYIYIYIYASYVFWIVHHLDNWIKRDQLDVTCFFISLFNAQHVSDVNASILRSLRLICWVISWVVLLWFDACWCYVVVWLGWCGIRIPHKLLRIDVLTSKTCWALNNEIKKQVTSSWSLFIQLYICCYSSSRSAYV